MALQSSGNPISLQDIQNEFGGSNPINISEYYRGGTYVPDTTTNSDIPTSGTIKLSDFYDGSNVTVTLNSYILNRASTSEDACSSTVSESVVIYQDSTSFNFNQDIFQDQSGTNFAQSGWYSDSTEVRFWGGSSWSNTTQICSFGGGGGGEFIG